MFWRQAPEPFLNYNTTFKVDRMLKGAKKFNITISHSGSSGICGLGFEKNTKYTILATSNKETKYWTSACDYLEASIEEIENILSSED